MKFKSIILSFILMLASFSQALGIFPVLIARAVERKQEELTYSTQKNSSSEDDLPITEAEQSETETGYKSFMHAYFSKLNRNYGNNQHGSCMFVSLGKLFSYYDTYLNDSIVPENYEIPCKSNYYDMTFNTCTSPGTIRGDAFMVDRESSDSVAKQYYNYLESIKDVSLHAKLILLGNKYTGNYNFKDDNEPCSATMEEGMSTLDAYLQNERGFDKGKDYSYEVKSSGGSDAIKQYIIQQIKAGYPVLISIGGKSGCHACIAYDYDSEGTVYFHLGRSIMYTHVTLKDAGYDEFCSAAVLKFNMKHSHTDNYWLYSDTEMKTEPQKYCYCDHRIITYKQLPHEYTDHYTAIDSSNHAVYCACGASKTESHLWQLSSGATLGVNPGISVQTIEPNLVSINKYVECKYCHFRKQVSSGGGGELIPIPGCGLKKPEEDYC